MGTTSKSIGRGQTIKCGYGLDNQDNIGSDFKGGKVGGGTDNISHSLKGATVVDDETGAKSPNKSPSIPNH